MKYFIFLLTFFLFSINLFSQNYNSNIKIFFDYLISDSSNIIDFIDSNELRKSERLNITYQNVENKILISYGIDPEIKENIKSGKSNYNLKFENLEEGFKKVIFTSGKNYKKEFYFKNGKFILPQSYFTLNWEVIETDYFNFLISDRNRFNIYAQNKLISFVDAVLNLLNVNQNEKEILKKEKINYVLCKDEDEVKKITGFSTKGIYILASDEIITSYNSHFHEVSHLLINFRHKMLPVFTLPFFQEGFASAIGGRGGISRTILLNIGKFLEQSDFINLQTILTYNDFFQEDASLTYPYSAIYNFYLINRYGIEHYLNLYKTYSGDPDFVKSLNIDNIKLPPKNDFEKFIQNFKVESTIAINSDIQFEDIIFANDFTRIYSSSEYYKFMLKANVLITPSEKTDFYISQKFKESFPDLSYSGEKYLISVNSREINIYNLYTDILIDSYNAGFNLNNEELKSEDNFFVFYVKRNLFDEPLEQMNFTTF